LIEERNLVSSLNWKMAQQSQEVVKKCEAPQVPLRLPLRIQNGLSQTWSIQIENSKKINLNVQLKSQNNFNWLGQIKSEDDINYVKLTGLQEPSFGYTPSQEFQYSITEVDGNSTSFLEHGVASVMKCERSASIVNLCKAGDGQCQARCLPVKNGLGCYSCNWE
ncbi:MAG TPA: hypothetical protein PLJ21_09795, partial [Pseudobdellovibrionaceae bacterium]|nr:hypothetical protein [Pseudobdellovibrionaceae bacterium]